MGARVEARGLEVLPHVGDDRRGLGRQRRGRVLDHPIDVVDPESDAFHVECGDGTVERFRFFDQARQLIAARIGAQHGQQLVEAALRRVAVFGGHSAMIVIRTLIE